MPPRKKSPVKPPKPSKPPTLNSVPVNVAVERKLIDSKILLPEDSASSRFLKLISYAVILGGLAGASLIVYLKITNFEPGAEDTAPRISVPLNPSPSTATSTSTPENPPPPAGGPPAPVQVVEILATPTGFLNVRKGPATSFAQITRVNPGDAFILVSTDAASGWYEIKLADGSTGWITPQYATVK